MDVAKHWKTIVDTLQDGLLVIGPDGTIIAANPAAEKLTGYRAEELVGHSCRILNCTGCNIIDKGPGPQWCSLFSEGHVRGKECLITKKDRRSVHIVKTASVLRDEDGSVIGAVETLTDITEKIRQQQELLSLRKTFHLDDGYHGMLGNSPAMQKLFELIDNVAQTEAPVLIYGQSGTGKELVARAIHETSRRRKGPFVKVNCAALNENLLESELFGHVKGAYTGAERTRIGRFEAAHEGSIFLDEIGDIPLSTQVKLLRVLEEREIERVGDHQPISVDVRIITATNKDLENMIAQDLFREDLLFRINVFPLYCPPLSERTEDIPAIVQHFIQQNAAKGEKKIIGVTSRAMEILTAYSWPGNVRELRNIVEYAFVLCPGGEIGKEHLPPKIMSEKPIYTTPDRTSSAASINRERLLRALKQSGGNQSEAARVLGVSRVTVWNRMKKYNIDLKTIING
jgi:PAS domain S-box-containing protein